MATSVLGVLPRILILIALIAWVATARARAGKGLVLAGLAIEALLPLLQTAVYATIVDKSTTDRIQIMQAVGLIFGILGTLGIGLAVAGFMQAVKFTDQAVRLTADTLGNAQQQRQAAASQFPGAPQQNAQQGYQQQGYQQPSQQQPQQYLQGPAQPGGPQQNWPGNGQSQNRTWQ